MSKLTDHEDGVLRYEVLRRWTRKGHEVALMRLTNKAVPESADVHLMCECDFDLEDHVEDGKVVGKIRRNDPYKCRAKKEVRRGVNRVIRKRNAARWNEAGLAAAILDIHRRVEGGEYLGQHNSGMIYVQEVAKLLGRDEQEVWIACRALYAEEKLDLYGAILNDYVPRFRFPLEMAGIMAYVVEEPLGWPNGDAGGGYVAGLETEIQERLGVTSGKETFGRQWPNIDGRILAEYALEPAARTLRKVADMFEGDVSKLLLPGHEDLGPIMWEPCEEALSRLAAEEAEISPEVFRVFLRALLRLSFERVGIDRELRVEKVPPTQTLREMADYFEAVAANCRKPAKKD